MKKIEVGFLYGKLLPVQIIVRLIMMAVYYAFFLLNSGDKKETVSALFLILLLLNMIFGLIFFDSLYDILNRLKSKGFKSFLFLFGIEAMKSFMFVFSVTAYLVIKDGIFRSVVVAVFAFFAAGALRSCEKKDEKKYKIFLYSLVYGVTLCVSLLWPIAAGIPLFLTALLLTMVVAEDYLLYKYLINNPPMIVEDNIGVFYGPNRSAPVSNPKYLYKSRFHKYICKNYSPASR